LKKSKRQKEKRKENLKWNSTIISIPTKKRWKGTDSSNRKGKKNPSRNR